jgi:histidine ammonia-lyase
LTQVVRALRKEILPLEEDRILHDDMMAAKRFIETFSMDSELIDL